MTHKPGCVRLEAAGGRCDGVNGILYAALRKGATADDALSVDPVCRMAIDPKHAAGNLTHDGTEYYVCSLACAGRVAADPAAFTG